MLLHGVKLIYNVFRYFDFKNILFADFDIQIYIPQYSALLVISKKTEYISIVT